MSDFDTISKELHATAEEKGFWDYENLSPEAVLAKIALIQSEGSEVLEAYRKEHGSEKIVEEIADILIRTFDFYAGLLDYGVVTHSLEEVFNNKTATNRERARKHGNLL